MGGYHTGRAGTFDQRPREVRGDAYACLGKDTPPESEAGLASIMGQGLASIMGYPRSLWLEKAFPTNLVGGVRLTEMLDSAVIKDPFRPPWSDSPVSSPFWSHRQLPFFAQKCLQNTKERTERNSPLVTGSIRLANYE